MLDRISDVIRRGWQPGDNFGFKIAVLHSLSYNSVTLCYVNLFNLNSSWFLFPGAPHETARYRPLSEFEIFFWDL
jgi:hypothetical protein